MSEFDDEDLGEEPVVINTVTAKKVNYLNNKDMLKEIHRSKNSFSEYDDPKYGDYDVIVESLADIFLPEVQERGKTSRAARLSALAFEQAVLNNTSKDRPKLSEHKVKADTIDVTDLIYRVHTFEHIPLAPGRKKNPKSEADSYVKLNFKPFKHYIIVNDEAKEVGRSHFHKGKFSLDHGSITAKLARMFILMTNKYAQRGNWRGYCVDAETEALTQRGWLTHTDLTEDDTILSFNGDALAWSRVKSIYRGEFSGKMHKLTQQGLDCLITPNHKIVTTRGLVPVELLKESSNILLLADAVVDDTEVYADSLVELLGWIATEGCYDFDKNGIIKCISVYQNQGKYADRIRKCLTELGYEFSESIRKGTNITFRISRSNSKELFSILPNKHNFIENIQVMSTRQRSLFLETLIDGDGHRAGRDNQLLRYTQKSEEHINCVQALCAMLGRRSNAKLVNKESFGKMTSYYAMNIFSKKKNKTNGSCINMHGGKNNGRDGVCQLGNGKIHHPNLPTTDYTGVVWCPETEFGSFVARRNNTVYLTGNTYLDEMKGQALLQLSQMGLQFDEIQSDNPFSYYTMSLQNSFTRVLNLEKKNQELRDDLLIESGASPSFSRQLAIEQEIRRLREDAQDSAKDEHN
jgi:hypothetical protein